MRRRLLNLLTALSLLLCVAVCVLWVRSYWVTEGWECTHRRSGLDMLHSERGAVEYWLHVSPGTSSPVDGPARRTRYYAYPPSAAGGLARGTKRFAGVSYLDFTAPTGRLRRLVVPHWALVILSGAAPAAAIPARMRRRRRRACGLCLHCAYDLRATPERCPECGAVPA